MKNLMKQITKNGRIFWVTYFTFFLILAMPTHAWAYVDPATLTYVVQIIAGVFIAWVVLQLVYTGEKSRSFSLRTKHLLKKHEFNEQERMQQQQRLRKFTKTIGIVPQREEYK